MPEWLSRREIESGHDHMTADLLDHESEIRQNPIRWLILCGVLLVASIAIGTALIVGNFRERALNSSERELENTVLLLARHFNQQLQEAQIIQRDVIAYMESADIGSSDAFRSQMSTLDIHEMLRVKDGAFSNIGGVTLFDSDGWLINSSEAWPVPAVNVADRGYFRTFKSDPLSPAAVVEPVHSRTTGAWTTVFARKLIGRNGEFIGTVARGIEPAQFEQFFASVTLGKDATISMLHYDGTLLARYPHADAIIGQNFKSSPMFQHHLLQNGRAAIRFKSPIDGQDRLGSIRELDDFPIVVIATATVSEALADWRQQTRLLVGVATLSALTIAIILFLIVRQLARQHRYSGRRLALEKQRLDIALDNMTQGLLLFNSAEQLVVCNRRYLEIYGLSPDVIKPGCSFRDVIAHRKQTGSFEGDVDEYRDRILRGIAQEHVITVGTSGGRSIQIVNRPLAGGGWVATHEDVTDLRRREEALNKRSEQLVEAQRLGKIGDWSYRFGDANVWWSPHIYKLLAYDPAEVVPSRHSVNSGYEGDGASKVLASQAEVLRTGEPRSVDVKVRRGDGSVGDFAIASEKMLDDQGRIVGIAGTIQDISERKTAEEKLEKLAYFDPLTGLANRALFHREINDVLTRCGRTGSRAALLLLDLDRFKEVNDSLGHASGDELLGKVAQLISRVLGNNHFISRLGGDEFAIVLQGWTERAAVEKVATDVVAAISGTTRLERGEVTIGTSIGIALIPADGATLTDLQRNADLALYRAKESGRGRFVFFEPGMSAAMQHKIVLARELRRAVAENIGLSVHYQPQISLASGQVTGFEALMRWAHPTLGNVSPSEFIPIAESSQIICDLGLWILRQSAAQAKAWLDAGEPAREIAVNVSAAQIWHTDFALDVERVLKETGLPARLLCLELTESLLADHAEGRVRSVLMQLKRLGVTLALDDFGTDYSSLGYLTQLPFDKIKIDRIFVDGITESERARKLLEGIIALGRGLGMTIVAEGAETAAEVAILSQFRCDVVQGYIFARPTAATEALAVARSFEGRESDIAGSRAAIRIGLSNAEKKSATA
jgi:diguanylate cyclase (GGDEF)-like protein/PAS domain S-box-containing protein